MFSFLKKMFEEEKRELSTSWKGAPGLVKELNEDGLEDANDRAEQLLGKSDKLLDDLQSSLEEVKGYEDRQGIEAVEDVADNFYSSRKRLLKEYSFSEEPIQHREDLEDFIEEFEDVSRKEEAVMKRIKNEANSLFEAIKNIHDHIDQLDRFIDEEYAIVTSVKKLENQVEELEEISSKQEKLKEKIGEKDIEKTREDVSGLENQIDQLKQSEEWRKKERLETDLEDLRDEKNGIKSELEHELSKIERPVKKIVYNIESGDLKYNASLDKLKHVRDQDIADLDSINLSEVTEIAREEDFIDESQVDKLIEASENFEDFKDRKQKIAEIDEEIQSKKSVLDTLEVEDERMKLVNKLSSRKEDLREIKVDKENLQDKLKDLKQHKNDLIEDIEDQANELTIHEIEVKEK